MLGSRDGAVVRALTSYHCGQGLIPKSGVTCGFEFVVHSRLCSQCFSQGPSGFLPSQKPTSQELLSDFSPQKSMNITSFLKLSLSDGFATFKLILYFYFKKTGNHQDSLSDAKAATELQPTFLKAIVRGQICQLGYNQK